MNAALAGRAVLVTRPAGLGENLASLLGDRGAEAILMPAIDILPPRDSGKLDALIARLDEFDLAIFVSPSAAAMAHRAVAARRAWPRGLAVAAVGTGTASALAALGFANLIAPQGRGDSEKLAALPELAEVRGARIVVFRGEGGREALRETLQSRGAAVEYCECYRRTLPRVDPAPLLDRWRRGGVDAVSVTSAEGLANLAMLLGAEGCTLLRRTPAFVPHPRVGEAARALGIERVILTGAGDQALAEALADFFVKV